MAAQRSWKDVPTDLIAEIAHRVRCPNDRFIMSAACRAWCAAVPLRRRPHLPWLLLPYNRVAYLNFNETRHGRFFCAFCDGNHVVRVPHDTGGARFFGAYQGGWLFVARLQNDGHALVNLNGGHDPIPLPNSISLDAPPSRHRVYIVAATLSAPPVPSENCVAAAIVMTIPISYPALMVFWRMRSPQAPFSMRPPSPCLHLEDVIYHHRAFYFLTLQENLYVCTPEFQEETPLEELQVRVMDRRFRPVILDQRDLGRYLVESRGELLMAVRLRSLQEPTMSSSFRVFQMMAPDADHAEEYSWDELPTLDGRMLFVGHGHSRSYEVADFPELQDGVYFHDEVSGIVQMTSIGDFGRPEYPCSDNGIWSAPPDNVRRVYPVLAPSAYSSPVWFLH